MVKYHVVLEGWGISFPCPIYRARAVSSLLGTYSRCQACENGCWGEGKDYSLSRTLHRFIKRKKFDDELVESSLAKSSTRAKGASGVEPGRCSGSEPSSSEKKKVRDWEMEGVGENEVQRQILCFPTTFASWQESCRGGL